MKRKRVVTISEQEFRVLARNLLDRMAADGFVPEAVLGIVTGGALLVDSLPPELGGIRFRCSVQRPSTAVKQKAGLAQRILRVMPYQITDILRVIEDLIGERSAVKVPEPPSSLQESLNAVSDTMRERGLQSIAVIDDAVDSGATLACVLEALKERLPTGAVVRSAAITRTRSPALSIAQPDYVIFEDTLCRFHWSFDYKAPRGS